MAAKKKPSKTAAKTEAQKWKNYYLESEKRRKAERAEMLKYLKRRAIRDRQMTREGR
jgi:hypothetical protein